MKMDLSQRVKNQTDRDGEKNSFRVIPIKLYERRTGRETRVIHKKRQRFTTKIEKKDRI